MSDVTKIEWCDSTFNPWIGCTKVSPACDHCYAAVSTPARALGIEWGHGQPRRRTSPSNWRLPLRWNAKPFWQCDRCGLRAEHPMVAQCLGPERSQHIWQPARRRVFCASLADVFDNEVDPQWRADLFALIEKTPNLDWLLLTKRIGNVAKMAPVSWVGGPVQHGPDPTNIHGGWPANVWLGATICSQAEADRDIPKLLAVRAAVRFLSIEPLLGAVDIAWALGNRAVIANGFLRRGMFSPGLETLRPLDWIIVGGESGAGARPMHPEWVRSLRDQCATAGVPFLFKQWGAWAPSESWPEDIAIPSGTLHYLDDSRSDDRAMWLVGKKAAGRMLDGRLHDAFPEAA